VLKDRYKESRYVFFVVGFCYFYDSAVRTPHRRTPDGKNPRKDYPMLVSAWSTLAGTKPGQYFFFSIGAVSILAQTETFSQLQRVSEDNDHICCCNSHVIG
jgi:hypothetical protein